jgi:hypothetical protein
VKLAEIASGIERHLNRFERDPDINRRSDGNSIAPYWYARAFASGSRVFVTYVSFQGKSSLSKAEALEYLVWLNQGGIGTHWKQQREKKGTVQ